MSTPRKKAVRKPKPAVSRLVWFEVPTDDPARSQAFYRKMFGWELAPFGNRTDYWHLKTGGGDESPDGGMLTRKHPRQPITVYFSVASVTRSMARVEKLGGKVCLGKTAVPGMGYFAVCLDSEQNEFALWEMNSKAK